MNKQATTAAFFLAAVIHFGVALPVLAGSGQATKTPKSQAAKTTDTKAAEVEIKRLIEQYALSIDRADTKLGAQIWSTTKDVTFIHPRGHERGWEQVRRNFYEQTMGAFFSERKLNIHDVSIHVYPEGTAWAEFYWDFDAKLRKDGQPLKTTGRETQIFRKTPDGWRLVHVHYSGPAVTGERQGF